MDLLLRAGFSTDGPRSHTCSFLLFSSTEPALTENHVSLLVRPVEEELVVEFGTDDGMPTTETAGFTPTILLRREIAMGAMVTSTLLAVEAPPGVVGAEMVSVSSLL